MNKIELDKIQEEADQSLTNALLNRNKLTSSAKRVVTDEAMIYTIGVDSIDGHLNGLIYKDSSRDNAIDIFNEAQNFFKDEKRDFVVWIRDHKDRGIESFLNTEGYKAMREPGIAGMMINTRIEDKDIPNGYNIKKVQSLKDVSDYASVVKNAFSKDDNLLDKMYGNVNTLIADNIIAYVLYCGDEAVAASTTIYSGGVSGIYYLGTVEGHRGNGIGSYMTTLATNSGFDQGASSVILQASLIGEPIYKKLGYEVITHYRWYHIKI